MRKYRGCQICGLLRAQRTAPQGTSEKLVRIPASEIEPCRGGEIVSPHNMSNQRHGEAVLWWGRGDVETCPLDIRRQVTESNMLGVGWLGGACALSVTPRQVLKSYECEGPHKSFSFSFFLVVGFSHKDHRAPYILHMAEFYSLGTNGTASCSECEEKFPLDENVNDRTPPLTRPS